MSASPGRAPEWPVAAYAAALACLPGVGPAWLVDTLAQHAPEQAWALVLAGQLAPPLKARPGGGAQTSSEAARRVDVGEVWDRCERNRIDVTWPGQPGYPLALTAGPAPAGVLFCAGSGGTFESRPCVAIVGTRRCTPDGAATAYQLAYELSMAGVCVVSGLALGIDGAAHAGALAAVRDLEKGDDGDATVAGSTVGVAASGVDVVYPRQHRGLWKEVVSLGAVVSETPPGWPAQAWRFPSRNRLIAGLARIVVVVECHASGGSWHTVDSALRRGVEVGAVPGPVHSSASVGTNTLLHEGATPIRGAQDVLDALGLFDIGLLDSDRATHERGALGTGRRPLAAGARPRPGQPAAHGGARGGAQPAAAGDSANSGATPAATPTTPWPMASDHRPPAVAKAPTSSASLPASHPASGHATGPPLGPVEQLVRAALSWRPLCLEEIVERSALPAGAVVVALDRLEEEGIAQAEAGWWFRKGTAELGTCGGEDA